jgi:protein-disulfide isomerase
VSTPVLRPSPGELLLDQNRRRFLCIVAGAFPLAPARARAQMPEPKVRMKIDGGYALGAKTAPLTMVEFTDYQCGFCRRFHQGTFQEIRKKYVDPGKLRFVSRDLPLDFHASAFRAAEAARCAGDQGQYWKLREILISNGAKVSEDDLLAYSETIPLDILAFRACLGNGKHRPGVQKDVAEAQALGISGTPTFVVGRTTPDGVDGVIVVGALPFPDFDEKLQQFEQRK